MWNRRLKPQRRPGFDIGVGLWLVALALAGCSRPATQAVVDATPTEAPVLKAEVFTVVSRPWPSLAHVPGSLFADETADVGAKVAGRVAKVNVELGDTVVAGQPLASLDLHEFDLQVTQAQAQLEQARAAVGLAPNDPVEKLVPENSPPVREARAVLDEAETKSKRWVQLRKQNAVTEADAEAVIAAEQVAAAKYSSSLNGVREKIALIGVRAAELDLAKQHLAEAVITAPFDGLAVERHVAPGTYVQIGDMIATIVRTDPLHFRGMMPERYARRLAVGQEVELKIEAVSEPRQVHVTRISPRMDPLSRALLFEAEIANPDRTLRSGLFTEAKVTLDAQATAIVLPESAVIEFAGVEKVWKVVEGSTQEQVVLTAQRRDGQIEIVDGVSAGDILLVRATEGRVAKVEPIHSAPVDPSLTSQDAATQETESVSLETDDDGHRPRKRASGAQ
jgi:membrane fusion protein, multidrug efflux system